MTSGHTNRIYELDILRAFAILFVLYSHAFFLVIDHVNEKAYNILSLDGVTIFFVLSGFLIGGILLRTINQTDFNWNNLLEFWIRRWFRTLPNYFLMLILLTLITVFSASGIGNSITSYFFFLQNFASPHPAFFPEAWSLTVEEWFYLLIPLGLYITLKISKNHRKTIVLAWIIFLILLVTGIRIYRALTLYIPDFETWDHLQRKIVITRLDSIMYGFLGAWVNFYFPVFWKAGKRNWLFLGLILLVFPMGVDFFLGKNLFFLNYFSLIMTSAGTLLMLPYLSEWKTGKGFIYRFLTFVSITSYSMYLVNFSLVQLRIIPSLTPVIVAITKNHLVISCIRYFLYWGLTFMLSYLLYRFYEKPFTSLRDHFRKSRLVKAEAK
ncbi:MAG: acyltransferase [Bacteroidales bacterium]|nr:acyltransferase [Bacteroidales bacterium]